MAVKIYKPTTPGRRGMTVPSFEEVTKFSPEKKLTVTLKSKAGRNSYGRITVRHQGGGNKKKYRIIDFKRQTEGAAQVIGVEYDPNRTAYIALVEYEDGTRSYVLAPVGPGRMEFENIPLDASEKMQDDLMDALEPFHFEKKKPFDMSYLSGFLAEKYTYQPKDLFDRMTDRITPGVENKAAEGGRGYQRVYGVKCHTDFSSDKQTYVLLPVWMLISKYQGKDYLFAMNGQTGKIVGELPVSNGQAAKWFGIIFAIVFIIAMLISVFVVGGVF